MGQDLKWSFLTQAAPGLAEQKQSMLAKERAIFGILIGDRESLAVGRVGAFRRGKSFQKRRHAVECPSQIDRGRSRLNQQIVGQLKRFLRRVRLHR